MIRAIAIQALRQQCPQFQEGIDDYRAGIWHDIADHQGSFIYELGRLYAQETPETDQTLGSHFIHLSAFLEDSIRQIVSM